MAHLIRGLIFVLAAPAVGYILMVGVSPSEDEARRKLKQQNDPASERIRQQNQALMKQLQKQAGITDEQLKKK